LEIDEVARFKYKVIWDAVDRRSKDVWPMAGLLIGTALLLVLYATVNLNSIGFPSILVLAAISIAISKVWIRVYKRTNEFNDFCFERLKEIERIHGRKVGNAQIFMDLWSENLRVGRSEVRRGFHSIEAVLIVAWVALICIKLLGLK